MRSHNTLQRFQNIALLAVSTALLVGVWRDPDVERAAPAEDDWAAYAELRRLRVEAHDFAAVRAQADEHLQSYTPVDLLRQAIEFEYGAALVDEGLTDAALDYLQDFVAAYADEPWDANDPHYLVDDALLLLSDLHLQRRDFAAAQAYAEDVLQRWPTSECRAQAWRNVNRALIDAETADWYAGFFYQTPGTLDHREAVEDNLAVLLDEHSDAPACLDALLDAARYYNERRHLRNTNDDWAANIVRLTELAEALAPRDPRTLMLRAYRVNVLFRDTPVEAFPQYQALADEALALHAEAAYALVRMLHGELLMEDCDTNAAAATAIFEELLEHPLAARTEGRARTNLGRLAAGARGDYEAALGYYTFVGEDPRFDTNARSFAQSLRVMVLHQIARDDEALAVIEQVLANEPNGLSTPACAEMRAMILEERGAACR